MSALILSLLYNPPGPGGDETLPSPVGKAASSTCRSLAYSAGWVYYHFSNVMQYSNTALEITALVMHDSNTFYYLVPLFLVTLQIL